MGIAIVLGPWMYRLAADLTAERTERVRTQERADLAAHLHDSVLQTLALIQKNAGDARRWRGSPVPRSATCGRGCTSATPPTSARLRGRCGRRAAAVEDAYGISVDVVTVGDCAVNDAVRPLVAAVREALTNAAKHAGVDRVDLYAEVSPTAIEAFVRDRGRGFDPAATATDRRGIEMSIVGPDGPTRRQRPGAQRAGGRHRGARGPAPAGARGAARWLTQVTPDRPRPARAIRVVIVDDHAMFRRGVRAELEAVGEGLMDVLGEAADVDEALAAIAEHQPEVVLLDVHLPGGGGVEVMRRLHRMPKLPMRRPVVPGVVGQRCGRGRHRHHPRRSPWLRHQDDHRPGARLRDHPRGRG